MPRNKRNTVGRNIRDWSGGEVSFRKPRIDLEKLVGARVNRGMITSIDSADIPVEALQLARNAKVLFDKTGRRDGLISFGPTPPNNFPVLKIANLKYPDGTGHNIRFTPTTLHDLQSGIWEVIAQTVPLVGTINDRIKIANLLDIFAFTNNGANEVQWIDVVNHTSDNLIENLSTDLGPFAIFRYCTGFFNRLVLASLREENEVLLAWTGEYGSKGTVKKGLEDLDPLINETSGFSKLIESPGDNSDFITGIFGLSNVMIILREKSIWIATKQASATNPFNAYPVVPGIGCDFPYSAVVTSSGICWLDGRTKSVYLFSPGSFPQSIGSPIEKSILTNVENSQSVFGTYDPRENVYSICIPEATSNLVRSWSFYFRNQAWVYNEYQKLTSFDEIELLADYVSIDDLVGNIDDLIGSIDGLNPVKKGETKRIFGFSDGVLAIPDSSSILDLASVFFTDLISKTFVIPATDVYIAMIVVEYEAITTGEISIHYATDGGVNPITSFTLGDIFDITVLNKPQIITFRKVIHCRRFAFAIRSDNCQFEVLSYEVWITPSSDISMERQV